MGPTPADLGELVDRVPEGGSEATYAGARWSVARTSRVGGRAVSIYAERLDGTDVVSTNVYRTGAADELRPCEMPAEKVVAFLRQACFETLEHPPAGAADRDEVQHQPDDRQDDAEPDQHRDAGDEADDQKDQAEYDHGAPTSL